MVRVSMTEPKQIERRPWPMTWVVLAIVLFITLYTVINVGFRKEESPHLPYEEAQERQSRFFEFDMNGWKWLEATPGMATFPETDQIQELSVSARPLEDRLDQDMPMDLVTAIPRRPDLIELIRDVSVVLIPGESLRLALIQDPQSKEPFGIEAFYKEGRLIILAVKVDEETAPPELTTFTLAKSDDWSMEPCTVSLYTEKTVYEWEIEERDGEDPTPL